MAKILINSIPKSGTYRIAALLQHAGIQSSGLHITEDKVWDYAMADIDTGRAKPESTLLEGVSPAQALQRITDNQSLVGHFGFSIHHSRLLKNFTTIFLIRDIREVVVSWCRWQVFSGQSPRLAAIDDPKQMIVSFLELSAEPTAQIVLSLLPWYFYLPPEHIFRVADLDQTEVLRQLFDVCGCPQTDLAINNIRQSVGAQDTLTKVPGDTLLENHWSSHAEQIFCSQRLQHANRMLGFPECFGYD